MWCVYVYARTHAGHFIGNRSPVVYPGGEAAAKQTCTTHASRHTVRCVQFRDDAANGINFRRSPVVIRGANFSHHSKLTKAPALPCHWSQACFECVVGNGVFAVCPWQPLMWRWPSQCFYPAYPVSTYPIACPSQAKTQSSVKASQRDHQHHHNAPCEWVWFIWLNIYLLAGYVLVGTLIFSLLSEPIPGASGAVWWCAFAMYAFGGRDTPLIWTNNATV